MDHERQDAAGASAAAVEHLTGPCRGTVTWLSGRTFDISVTPDRLLEVVETPPGEPRAGLVARLHCRREGYRIESLGGQPLWVNGRRVESQPLAHCDMIEFGETGPLSRFRLFAGDRPATPTTATILSDAVAYLRTSRQPPIHRLLKALGDAVRRLTWQTTLLFRLGTLAAFVVVALLAYQQGELNRLLERRIEIGASQLDSFARALARTRGGVLTPRDLEALREELEGRLSEEGERLAALEARSGASGRVIAASMPSVGFIQGAYGFREQSTGRMLRHVLDDAGRRLVSPWGEPVLSLEGEGPVAERQVVGTGFVVGVRGALVTNRHVALPWEDDLQLDVLAGRDLQPEMIRLVVYLPNVSSALEVALLRASDEADVALLTRTDGASLPRGLPLGGRPPAPGDEVILLGYPTGLRSMLAQAGAAFVDELQRTGDTDFWSIASRLSAAGKIAPLASRGIIGQVTETTTVYDADTTLGGSGGPVLDTDGAVVAVNAAVLPEYGGSNLGVPAAQVAALLAAAGL